MRTILLITMLLFGVEAEANDSDRPLYRPSFGMFAGKDHSDDSKAYRFSSYSSHLQLELAHVDRCQISLGFFSFYKTHNYSTRYSSSSFDNSPFGWSSSSTSTTYNCKLQETTHSATIAAGWNSRFINNRVHFEINLGAVIPLQEKYSVSEISGIKRNSHSMSNGLYGYTSSSQTIPLIATEQNLHIPKQNATRWSNYLSFQTSFVFRSYLELGIEMMLISQPIRAGNHDEYDYNKNYTIRNFGLRLTYNW